MESMPKLKMVHSEGVAYNMIDLDAAKRLGIYVCNNKGMNAGAVAEQAILLMLALLRHYTEGVAAEKAGLQINKKEQLMLEGITELSDCKVGLIGFGDIAKATAKRLLPFGCGIYYYSRTKKSPEIEKEYGVTYMDLDSLIRECDIISIHTPVTKETTGMVNAEFLSKMKKTAYLINTARGAIVDNEALKEALINGDIAGAGFDTIAPEPTAADNPLVNLPPKTKAAVEYSPHIGGVTTSTFKRCHKHLWENAKRVSMGEEPDMRVI